MAKARKKPSSTTAKTTPAPDDEDGLKGVVGRVLRGKNKKPPKPPASTEGVSIRSVLAGTVSPADLDAKVQSQLEALRTAARGRNVRDVNTILRQFASTISGKPEKELNFAGLRGVRRGVIGAFQTEGGRRVGVTQLGAITASLLEQQKIVTGATLSSALEPLAKRLKRSPQVTRARLAAVQPVVGKPPGPTSRFLRSPKLAGLKGFGTGIAGFLLANSGIEAVKGKLAGPEAPEAPLPSLLVPLLEQLGPGAEEALAKDPALAVALFDRLQLEGRPGRVTGDVTLRGQRGQITPQTIQEILGG